MEYSFRGQVCGVFLIAVVILPACSTTPEIPEYTGSRLLPALEIPPDLDTPVFNKRMVIPEPLIVDEEIAGDDMTSKNPRSIEEPPVFLEEDNSAN